MHSLVNLSIFDFPISSLSNKMYFIEFPLMNICFKFWNYGGNAARLRSPICMFMFWSMLFSTPSIFRSFFNWTVINYFWKPEFPPSDWDPSSASSCEPALANWAKKFSKYYEILKEMSNKVKMVKIKQKFIDCGLPYWFWIFKN